MLIGAFLRSTLVIAVLCAGFALTARAQDRADERPLGTDPSIVTLHSTLAGEALPDLSFDPSATGEYIVTFTAPALAGGVESAGKALVDDQHARFQADFGRMAEAASKQSERSENVIRHEYRTVLNGAAITTTAQVALQLSRLSYVSAVHPDAEVRALDRVSNGVIGATRARNELGLTGSGVTVAVLDTGIDYTHPALGGGIGSGFKVVGGYNFVEDNEDPIDRHGHGTHVAGIIAGNDRGSFLGVAPEASLLAYKVLSDGGSGRTSWVIAAIEQAVMDGADVMNLSLGGSGHPDDPASQAIDNASLAGVLCVVAAGNDGAAYTINSPGTARRALTVGATDNSDGLASFSSRGPSGVIFGSKPDVVAPGVGIVSTIPGDRYATMSGTSMAAPHVAGAAALLKERHPQWTERDLKSALTHTSVDLGMSSWRQGAGRIDVMAAQQPRASMSPVSLSFGNLDPAQAVVQSSQTVEIKNLTGQQQSWSVSAVHSIPGATITVSPNSFMIAAGGGSQTITINARFEPGTMTFPQSIDTPYAGSVYLSGAGMLRIPIAVTKTPQLTLDFDVPPFSVDVIGLESGYARANAPGNVVAIPLSGGVYDVIVSYLLAEDDRLVRGFYVREQLSINGRHSLSPRLTDLKNTLTFEALDKGGSPISHDYALFTLERVASSSSHDFSNGIILDDRPVVRLSDLSNRFKLEALLTNLGENGSDAYMLPFGRTGISNTITISSNPAAYRTVETSFNVPSTVDELFVVPRQIRISSSNFLTMSSGYATDRADRHRISAPFARTVHYGAKPYDSFGYRYMSYEVFDSSIESLPSWDSPSRLWQSPMIEATPDEIRFLAQIDFNEPLRTSSAPVIRESYGSGPISFDGRMWNVGTISLHRFDNRRYGLFSGSEHETITSEVTYRLVDESGSVISEGPAAPHFLPGPFITSAGVHEMEVSLKGGFVDDLPVRAVAKSRFDSRYSEGLYDPDPPMINALYLTTDGERTSSFEGEGNHALVAYIRDTQNQGGPVARAVSEASLGIRGMLEHAWTVLPVSRSGNRFTAQVSDQTTGGYYDLRILALDASGNTLDYVVEPAFRLGTAPEEAPSAPVLSAPEDHAFVRLHDLNVPMLFTWDSGEVARHAFTLAGADLDTTIVTTERSVSLDLSTLFVEGRDYEWYVTSTDGFVTVESERFILRARGLSTSGEDASEIPLELALHPAYPNPFNPSTTLQFSVPEAGHARMEIFDMLGRLVGVLVDELLPAGRHERTWHATGVPSGVYVIRLTNGRNVSTQRATLLK